MNISQLWRILLAQRFIVGSAALLSIAACVLVYAVAPPTYRASASVVLLNPPALPEPTVQNPTIPPQYQNPYARFGDLSVVVDILVRVLDSTPVVDTMKASGLNGTFEVAANRDFYRGPIVDIAAEGPSAAAALDNASLVLKTLNEQLLEIQQQEGTDPSYYIRAELVVAPDKATTVFSATLRKLILTAGGGVVLTIGSGLLGDFVKRRREPNPVRQWRRDRA